MGARYPSTVWVRGMMSTSKRVCKISRQGEGVFTTHHAVQPFRQCLDVRDLTRNKYLTLPTLRLLACPFFKVRISQSATKFSAISISCRSAVSYASMRSRNDPCSSVIPMAADEVSPWISWSIWRRASPGSCAFRAWSGAENGRYDLVNNLCLKRQ